MYISFFKFKWLNDYYFGGLVSGGGQGGHGPSKIFVEVAAWSNVGYNYIIFSLKRFKRTFGATRCTIRVGTVRVCTVRVGSISFKWLND